MTKKHFMAVIATAIGVFTLGLIVAVPAAHAEATDPCISGVKRSAAFDINTGSFQQVIAGTAGKRTFICGVVFTASANQGLNVNFAGGSSGCNSNFTFLGTLFPANDAVTVAGGGSSTQFTVPSGDSFCIELGGATPLQADGWVTYIVR